MAKKSTRKIPTMVLSVIGDGTPDVETLCSNEVFSKAVYIEAVESIKDAIKSESKTAILFELGKSEYYVELDKSEWKQSLQSCMDRYIEKELYEACAEIKILIDKIN
jgi:hypothetical protein